MFRDEQSIWNIFFSVIYLILAFVLYLSLAGTIAPAAIPLFDALLLALATFRLVRLFVYDTITQFVRDIFLDVHDGTEQGGELIREKPAAGPRRTLATLLGCPWCFSAWPALLLTWLYFYTPHAWFFILVLALSGVGAILQIAANLLGWSAEFKKRTVTGSQSGGQHSGTCG